MLIYRSKFNTGKNACATSEPAAIALWLSIGAGIRYDTARKWHGEVKALGLLQGFELEFHHFSTNHIAEVVFPKSTVARKVIHQKFEAQPAPECQQADAHGNFA